MNESQKPGNETVDITQPTSAGGQNPTADPGTIATGEFTPADDRAGGTVDFVDPRAGATVDPEQGVAFDTERLSASGTGKEQKKKAPAEQPTVPGYEILDELGRGGMGVVYKARQVGLNRLVALKMVLAGAHAGPDQLARFHTEAEAVAQLVHPNIVQIYEVNEHNGLPFFSLEFVDGKSLDRHIARKPQPVRATAEMVQTLARAMQYAHQHHIIHRDLKPANVLLTGDGVPKITDFGLAKRLESDSSQTRSGTLMGTPSYMAPEQARGDVKETGPLADIYALGVILYEMLTGRVPFMGAAILDTLEQVRTQEPVPPSRLQPKVPVDLETICLKCLQKEPHRRYATAGELADDLRRFLSGEPILARPVSGPERLWRWCRRNPVVASWVVGFVAVLIAGTITSTALAFKAVREKDRANEERDRANEERDRANEQEQLAKKNADEARGQHGKAIEGVIGLVDDLQRGLETTSTQQKLDRKQQQALRQTLMTLATKRMNEAAASIEQSGLTPFGQANIHNRMGRILRQFGHSQEAFHQFKQGYEIVKRVADEQPDNEKAQANLAALADQVGNMRLELDGDAAAAREYYVGAFTRREKLVAQPPSNDYSAEDRKGFLANSHDRFGMISLREGDPAAAQDYYRKVLPVREEQATAKAKALEDLRQKKGAEPQAVAKANGEDLAARGQLAAVNQSLADVAWRLRDVDSARRYHGKSLELRESLAKRVPNSLGFKLDLAGTHNALGDFHLRQGNAAAAKESYDKALDLVRQVLAKDPELAAYRYMLGRMHYRMGTVLLALNQPSEAAKHYADGLKVVEEMAAEEPENQPRQVSLMVARARCNLPEKAAEIAVMLRQKAPYNSEQLLYIGCAYALCSAAVTDDAVRQQYLAQALEALTEATRPPFKDVVAVETDPDLEPLRNHPGFKALVEKIKQH